MKPINCISLSFVLILLASSGAAYAQSVAWQSDPIVTAEDCDKLEYLDIATFLETYYYPSLVYAGGQKESGQKMLFSYAIASTLINRSQSCLAEALALKKLADKLKKQNALLLSGTSMSKRQLKKQRKLTAQANDEIEAAAAEIESLTPEQRERFGKGSAAYFAGTYATSQLFRSIDDYLIETKDEMVQAAPTKRNRFGLPDLNKVKDVVGAVGKANTVRLVFSGLKDHMGELYTTSRFLSDYSKKNDVELPEDATGQLAEVSDWV